MVKTFPFTKILGWSSSRYETFSICKRRYFYQYYGKFDTEFPLNQIEKLKHSTSIPLETGSTIHNIIHTILRRIQIRRTPLDLPELDNYIEKSIESRIEHKQFIEILYNQKNAILPDDLREKVARSIMNFINSDRFFWLLEIAEDSSESWLIEPPGYGETRISNLKAYIKVDLLIPHSDALTIIDWKSGKVAPSKNREQLVSYASWAISHFEKEPADISAVIAYLYPEYHEVQEKVNEFDTVDFSLRVSEQTQEMYSYCRNVEENIPLEKESFPLIEHNGICSNCKFRSLCYPERYPLS